MGVGGVVFGLREYLAIALQAGNEVLVEVLEHDGSFQFVWSHYTACFFRDLLPKILPQGIFRVEKGKNYITCIVCARKTQKACKSG